jgi:hypothetical protein
LLRLLVTLLTFLLGSTSSAIHNRWQKVASSPAAPAILGGTLDDAVKNSKDQDYPPSMPDSLSPGDIESFINLHPDIDLTKIWRSLGIENSDDVLALTKCSNCKAESFHYDLDDEPGHEILLKVSEQRGERARFLAFKWKQREDHWKLLGHADGWAKYIETYHMILLSGGKPWLVVRSQGASGSGIALYVDQIYQISGGRLRRVAAYRAEGVESGGPDAASRQFIARVASCEVKHGQAIVKLDLSVAYSFYDPYGHRFIDLFEKRQRATMLHRLNEDTDFLDTSRSNLSEYELDSVYNVDSMYENEFVKFNLAELSRIAGGKDLAPKKWLSKYLKTLEQTAEVRRLEQILRYGRG